MKTVIFSNFLKQVIDSKVDLVNEKFSIALLDKDFFLTEDLINFHDIQNDGYEITGPGYEEGGKSIIFEKVNISSDKADYCIYQVDESGKVYTSNKVKWGYDEPATFSAKFAVIYRTNDGLLVSGYEFDEESYVKEGLFTISWNTSSILTINVNVDGSGSGGDITIENILSFESHNVVENATTTSAFAKLGIRMEDEELPDVDDGTWEEMNLDSLSKIKDSSIDDMFKDNNNG